MALPPLEGTGLLEAARQVYGRLPRSRPPGAPRRTQALAALCHQLSQARARYLGTDLVLRYEVKSHPNPA